MSRIADAAFGDRPYPGSPGFKEPTTSRAAAAAIAGDAKLLLEKVYQAFVAAGPDGLTADEAAKQVSRLPGSVRPRVTELAKEKPPRLAATSQRRKNESGMTARVWRAI